MYYNYIYSRYLTPQTLLTGQHLPNIFLLLISVVLMWLILLISLVEIIENEQDNNDHCQTEYYQFHFTVLHPKHSGSVGRKQLIESLCVSLDLNILDKIVNVNISQIIVSLVSITKHFDHNNLEMFNQHYELHLYNIISLIALVKLDNGHVFSSTK